jgi:hypothetical protein
VEITSMLGIAAGPILGIFAMKGLKKVRLAIERQDGLGRLKPILLLHLWDHDLDKADKAEALKNQQPVQPPRLPQR